MMRDDDINFRLMVWAYNLLLVTMCYLTFKGKIIKLPNLLFNVINWFSIYAHKRSQVFQFHIFQYEYHTNSFNSLSH